METQHTLLKKNFESIGIALFETALAWWGSEKKLASLAHFHGIEHYVKALEKKRGIIILAAHFTNLQLIGRLVVKHYPFCVMYHKQRNPILNYLTEKYVQQYFERSFTRSHLRSMTKTLQEKYTIWYTPDIDPGKKNSIFAPFFGIQAASLTTLPRLAALTEATILPLCYTRRDDGTGYDIRVFPHLENFPSGDLTQDVVRINQEIEKLIRQKPEQYMWQYKRFKTRPDGDADFYV